MLVGGCLVHCKYLAVTLTSTHWMLVASPSSTVIHKNVSMYLLMAPGRWKYSQFRTCGLSRRTTENNFYSLCSSKSLNMHTCMKQNNNNRSCYTKNVLTCKKRTLDVCEETDLLTWETKWLWNRYAMIFLWSNWHHQATSEPHCKSQLF